MIKQQAICSSTTNHDITTSHISSTTNHDITTNHISSTTNTVGEVVMMKILTVKVTISSSKLRAITLETVLFEH
jgi:hypothetical protein